MKNYILTLLALIVNIQVLFGQTLSPWNPDRIRYTTDSYLNNQLNGTGPYFQYPLLYPQEHFKNYFDWGNNSNLSSISDEWKVLQLPNSFFSLFS